MFSDTRIVDKSYSKLDPVLADFSFLPKPQTSTKTTNGSRPLKGSKLRKYKGDLQTNNDQKTVYNLPRKIANPIQWMRRPEARKIQRVDISNPINVVEKSTQNPQVNARALNLNITRPMTTQTYYRSNPIDRYRYVLRSLDEVDQRNIEAYTELVIQNSAHFAEHQIFVENFDAHPVQRRRYLGCTTNSLDLVFCLGVNPVFISSDLLYFIAHKAWAIVSVLNKNGFALDQRVTLLNCLQVWTNQEGRSHEVFHLKLGKCSRDIYYHLLMLIIGSLAALFDSLSIHQDYKQLNIQALDTLLNVILKIAKAITSSRPETFHFPDRELSSLKQTIAKPGEPRHSIEKVQINLAQIYIIIERSVWLFFKKV